MFWIQCLQVMEKWCHRNYVLQYVLELQLKWVINGILEQLEGNYTELSMQKCSSNVVEKCLRLADDKHLTRIIRELVNYGLLDQVMLDPYGNYVIQAALKRSKVKHTNHKTVDWFYIQSLENADFVSSSVSKDGIVAGDYCLWSFGWCY